MTVEHISKSRLQVLIDKAFQNKKVKREYDQLDEFIDKIEACTHEVFEKISPDGRYDLPPVFKCCICNHVWERLI